MTEPRSVKPILTAFAPYARFWQYKSSLNLLLCWSIPVWRFHVNPTLIQSNLSDRWFIMSDTRKYTSKLNKLTKTPTDFKTIVLKEYHNFLDVFSKEVSDTLSSHSKYNHQIQLLKGYKIHSNSLLWSMFEAKLQFIKKFLEKNLKRSFLMPATPHAHHLSS